MLSLCRPVLLLLACCLVVAVLSLRTQAIADDWPQWRGPANQGSLVGKGFPDSADEAHIVWRQELPGKGCSTPVVLGRQIYLTAPAEGKDAVLCYSEKGKPMWRTAFGAETTGKHRNGSGSNASPTTDGSGVFVYFKSGTLAALELDGKIRWQTNLVERYGEDQRFWDHGTSPVLTEKYLVMARMHAGDSWLAAFDKTTGEVVWKVARNYEVPTECDQVYTTPLVIDYQGRESLLVWGADHLTIHDTEDGSLVWSCGNFNPQANTLWPAIASPVIVDDMAVIAYGRNDRRQPKLFGIRLTGKGDVTDISHIWQRDDVGTFVPTPAVHNDLVYFVRDHGEVECVDPKSGKTIWKEELPKSRANFYASPLIAGDRLYAIREDGTVFVASLAGNQFQLLSTTPLGESIIASPAPLENRILIRGEKHLFCIGSPKTAAKTPTPNQRR
jgi:outer membrane protein assembly factor BamB